ncbi:MAG TPA: GDYXXLXY domain-containing protein [Dongiaceae bacterium]|nr:GDYXXLXY domain-containing protein [Dongiaceae bacterium]
MKKLRLGIAIAGLALALGLANWTIVQKRAVIDNGRILLLELRPADPRSLFQGDYMALALADDTMPDAATISTLPYRGTVIMALDGNGVGRFSRLDDEASLKPGELRVQYRRHQDWRGPRLDYGAQSFFFQEGDAELYRNAKYALLRVAEDGSTVLTDLAGDDRVAIRAHHAASQLGSP